MGGSTLNWHVAQADHTDGVGTSARRGRLEDQNNVKGLRPKSLPFGASGIQHVFSGGPRASQRLRVDPSLDPSLLHRPLSSSFSTEGTGAGRTLGEGRLDESPPPRPRLAGGSCVAVATGALPVLLLVRRPGFRDLDSVPALGVTLRPSAPAPPAEMQGSGPQPGPATQNPHLNPQTPR